VILVYYSFEITPNFVFFNDGSLKGLIVELGLHNAIETSKKAHNAFDLRLQMLNQLTLPLRILRSRSRNSVLLSMGKLDIVEELHFLEVQSSQVLSLRHSDRRL